MKTQFNLNVSHYCIQNGVRNSLRDCVLALAVRESIPGADRPTIDDNEIRFSFRKHRYIYKTPEQSAKNAKDFDTGVVTRSDMKPWRDILKDPISVEPTQYRPPRKNSKRHRYMKPVPSNGPKPKTKLTRWGGKKI